MSKELDELRRLARTERHKAWAHARLVPARVGDTASAFAKRHPILAMGGAAALTMSMISRRRKRAGVEGKPNSMPLALAAMGVQFMPEILRLVGLTVPTAKSPTTAEEQARDQHERCDDKTDGLVASAKRGSGPMEQHTR
ncbi:MAG: hypothetical protein SGI72_11545 [Planctomycetota bacterium]|nr:hypothetical protein [Planctomycetota bacterium]